MQDSAAASQMLPAEASAAADGGVSWWLGKLLAFGAGGVGLQVAVIVLQVVCVVHVIRHREDYWWILLVIFFPLVGSLVYFVVVIWPDLRRHSRRGGVGAAAGGGGRRRIRELERQVALSGTVAQRAELAAAYCEAGQFTLARQGYEGCIQGLYAQDAHLLFGLATAQFGEGQFERCLDAIARIDRQDVPEHLDAMDVMRAKALLALGRDAEAGVGPIVSSPSSPGPGRGGAHATLRRGR